MEEWTQCLWLSYSKFKKGNTVDAEKVLNVDNLADIQTVKSRLDLEDQKCPFLRLERFIKRMIRTIGFGFNGLTCEDFQNICLPGQLIEYLKRSQTIEQLVSSIGNANHARDASSRKNGVFMNLS